MLATLTREQIKTYKDDGFIFIRGLFSPEEVNLLRRAMEEDPAIAEHSLLRADSEGLGTRISLWNRAGDSVYGVAARVAKMVDTAEALIGEPVYHFQSKLTAKDPKVGGAWEWHQDYGYWYYNGCLKPEMLSVMIALDRTDPNNGCLQIIKGSHKLGRIDHVAISDKQNGADPDRIQHILKTHKIIQCELDPGDVVFFHANALHRSDQNRSKRRRWTFIVCYNAVSNDTVIRDDDRYYVPLEKVGDDAIIQTGLRFADGKSEHFTSKAYVPDLDAIKQSF